MDPFVDEMTPEEAALWGIAPAQPTEAKAATAGVEIARHVQASHKRLGIPPHAETEAVLADFPAAESAGPPPSEDGPEERMWKIGQIYSLPAPWGSGKLLALDGDLGVFDKGRVGLASVGVEIPDEPKPEDTTAKPKRARRTKAEIEAARAMQDEAKALRDEHVAPAEVPAQVYTDDHAPENIAAPAAPRLAEINRALPAPGVDVEVDEVIVGRTTATIRGKLASGAWVDVPVSPERAREIAPGCVYTVRVG